MNCELSNQVSESYWTKVHNPEPENFLKSDPCRSPKIVGRPPRPQEISCKVTKYGTVNDVILTVSTTNCNKLQCLKTTL